MDDPFLNLGRVHRRSDSDLSLPTLNGSGGHHLRKHSKFSASGAERWINCPGSVQLSEGLPDKSSPWAEEGTRAHELLEITLKDALTAGRVESNPFSAVAPGHRFTMEMIQYARDAADFILRIASPHSEVLVETRIVLDFIHPEMFGTFDAAVVDHFGTLHVFDYKYGAGRFVSPKGNLQMIFYGLGLAYKYQWNFKRVRLWIIQPRVRGYDGPLFWDLSINELRNYQDIFEEGVRSIQTSPEEYAEGSWCHWCKAKSICPLKLKTKQEKGKSVFTISLVKSR